MNVRMDDAVALDAALLEEALFAYDDDLTDPKQIWPACCLFSDLDGLGYYAIKRITQVDDAGVCLTVGARARIQGGPRVRFGELVAAPWVFDVLDNAGHFALSTETIEIRVPWARSLIDGAIDYELSAAKAVALANEALQPFNAWMRAARQRWDVSKEEGHG